MAVRKPLVMVSGLPRQLPAGDTVAGADVASAVLASDPKPEPDLLDVFGFVNNESGTLNRTTWAAMRILMRNLIASVANTWTAMQTFTGIKETVVVANTGSGYTVDLSLGTIFDLTVTANTTYTFPTPAEGLQFTLLETQDATGARVRTYPSTVRWAGGAAPTPTGTAGRTDVTSFIADGAFWLAFDGGRNFARS